MIRRSFMKIIAVCFSLFMVTLCYGQRTNANFVNDLLKRMTLKEKVGQMAQITLDVVGKGKDRFTSEEPFGFDAVKLERALVEYNVGSVLNTSNNRARTPEVWYHIVNDIQQVATKKTRLGIPVIYGIDAVHGVTYTAGATLFPQQIAQAASFNRQLVYQAACITAYETRASAIPWNFSPILDLGADPRFPRQWESFGEDPYLVSELGKQMIKGYEGDVNNISHPEKVATSLKHFLGYQAPVSGKDRTPAYISDQALREYHLPAFKAAIEAGAHSVMVNSGIINGIPVHSNRHIITGLLKEELGFKGVVVTDWGDIENLYKRDHIAKDSKEAISIAINAGIDMSMIAYDYETFCNGLVELVNEGKVKEERINDAVRRILTLKYELGLFSEPVTDYRNYPKFGSKEFADASFQAAVEAITLLKNKGNILPLSKSVHLLIAGPNSRSMQTLDGAWSYSWQGDKVEEFATGFHNIYSALEAKVGKENVVYVPGVSYKADGKYYEEYADKTKEAIDAAKNADVIVLCLGENTYTETPGNLNDLYLSDLQTEFALQMAATGKPVVLILNEGRPRVISKIEDKMAAIVQAYLPGNYGGDALASILLGEINPSGKLPYTYPRYPNAIITYYHKPSEERTTVEGAYNYSADYNPQFKFGFGLSYTTFNYSAIRLNSDTLNSGGKMTISVDVTNTGNREGKEVVQLYISDVVASGITPDVKRLRGFEKIDLKPGETRTVVFTINPDDIAFVNAENKRVTEPGEFIAQVADRKISFQFDK